MHQYDLSVLNDKEFEVLVADLLACEFGVPVERFKSGKDGGVDLRWYSSPGNQVVVQCKHWPRSGVGSLIRKISTEEKKKVAALNPARYIFVCSLPLSKKNKDDIAEAFLPYPVADTDIMGYEDLQRLIGIHHTVERKHYKLWLASSNVLVALLNHGVLGRSADSVDEIRRALAKFVETEDCRRARRQLETARVLIIKGEPGVGKTTLAQQLVMESIAEDYQFVEIQADVTEAEGVFLGREDKQIFYFDDFLGRNFLEIIADNKDSSVLAFIRRVLRSDNKRFILTSRTHILDRGKQLSELFQIEKIGKREFELTVGALSRLEKGKILYSHIWNGGLPDWAIDSLYENNRYIEVIDHANFNPRIIAFITDPERLVGVEPQSFWSYVTDTLENPRAIWRHVFERQLNPDTRDLAILVTFNGTSISEDWLKAAFVRLNQFGADNPVQFSVRFHSALRLAVGSVINRTIGDSGDAKCELFNPSIADFLLRDEAVISRVADISRALQTVQSASYLASLHSAGYISGAKLAEALRGVAADIAGRGQSASELAIRVADLLSSQADAHLDSDFISAVANSLESGSVCNSESSARVFAAALLAGLIQDVERRFEEVLEEIVNCPFEVGRLKLILQCARWVEEHKAIEAAEQRSRGAIVSAALDHAQDYIVESSVLDDYLFEHEIGVAREEVRRCFARFFNELGFSLGVEEINEFVARVDVADIISDNANAASERWDDSDASDQSVNGDDAIFDYFDRSSRE